MGGPLKGARKLLPRWALSNTIAAAALAGAAAVAFLTTWFFLSPAVEQASRRVLIGLIVSNVIIAAGFALLVGARVWHVWSDRRNQLAGSATHLKLVGLFSAVAAVPAVIAFLFAFTILRSSLNDVFGERIENYQNTARDLANGLIEFKKGELELMLKQIAFDVRRSEEAGLGLEGTPISFREYLHTQAEIRGLDALYVLDGANRLLVRAEVRPGSYKLPSRETMDGLNALEPGAGSFGVNDDKKFDMFRVILKIPDYQRGYLIAYQPMEEATTRRLIGVSALRSDWEEARVSRARTERIFLAGYVILAIIILFGAIWLALWAATRIVQPIGRLVNMAGRVSGGDLGARVEVHQDDGELGALARAMNHMTAQLQTQRDDLVETNRQFDRRRRFTEAVLSGVSAGVVGINSSGRTTIANSSAAEIIEIDEARITGRPFAELLPEARELFEEACRPPFDVASGQITLERNGLVRTLNVRIVSDEVEGERSFVATFDDITQLISAQRSAAWGDIARRIAHEIKNPLTPIQLSAERLRRKYLGEIQSTPEVFDKCTDTIIRHVGDIGRMVDEFSSFARMPKPVMENAEIVEIVKTAVFSQRVASPDIEIEMVSPSGAINVKCDGRLVAQAIGNLLKNAAEAVCARIGANDSSAGDSGANDGGQAGRIRVTIERGADNVKISVADNGVGLPKAERHRLTEPYMTTRIKGTGLGLAIVKKVIEEHDGALLFDDCALLGPTGAVVSVTLPASGEGFVAVAAAE